MRYVAQGPRATHGLYYRFFLVIAKARKRRNDRAETEPCICGDFFFYSGKENLNESVSGLYRESVISYHPIESLRE